MYTGLQIMTKLVHLLYWEGRAYRGENTIHFFPVRTSAADWQAKGANAPGGTATPQGRDSRCVCNSVANPFQYFSAESDLKSAAGTKKESYKSGKKTKKLYFLHFILKFG